MSVKPWQAHRHLNVGDKIAFYGPRKTRNWFLSIQLFLVWKDATCKARNSLTVTSFWVQSVEITERSVDSWSRLLSNSHWWSSEVKVKARSPQSLNKSFRSSGKHLDFRENRLRIRSRILLRTVRAVSDWSTDRYRTVEKKMSLILEFLHLTFFISISQISLWKYALEDWKKGKSVEISSLSGMHSGKNGNPPNGLDLIVF